MIPKKSIFIILFCFCSNLFAQYTNSRWYFYEQRLIFSNGTARLEPTTIVSVTAQFVVTDCNGNLKLAAIGGDHIYNRNEQIMKGSQNLIVAQYSIIQGFVFPGSKDSIVIFHDITKNNPYQHYWGYSIIDFTKDSGRGEVIASNIKVENRPNPSLTILNHSNGKDIWILGTKDSINAYAYKFTNNGLDTVPVKSSGIFNNYMDSIGNQNYRQVGKCFAPFVPTWDSKKIIVTGLTKWRHATAMALIYDFDNSSGKITNPQNLFKRTDIAKSEYTTQKAAISLNDSFIYFGVSDPSRGPTAGSGAMAYYFQVNRFTKNKTLLRTQYITSPFYIFGFWGNTICPDGKILVKDWSRANSTNPTGEYWRVEKPNVAGVKCTYRKWIVDSFSATIWAFPTSISRTTPTFFEVNNNLSECIDTTEIILNGDTALNKIVLRFGDGDTVLFNGPFKQGLAFKHYYKNNGTFPVDMIVWGKYCNTPMWVTDTITVYKPPRNFTTQVKHNSTCTGDSIAVILKANNQARYRVNWGLPKPGGGFYDTLVSTNADSIALHFFYPETTVKYKTVFTVANNQCSLSVADSIGISALPKPNAVFQLNLDTACGNDLLILYDSNAHWRQSVVTWPNKVDTFKGIGMQHFYSKAVNSTVSNTQKIYIQSNNLEGCIQKDSFTVFVKAAPVAALNIDDTVICAARQAVNITGVKSINPAGTIWTISDGFDTQLDSNWNKYYNASGTYKVQFTALSALGCTDTATVQFQVIGLPKAGFDLNDDSVCTNQSITIYNNAVSNWDTISNLWFSSGRGDTVFHASTFQTSFDQSGLYTISQFVSTSQGCFDTLSKTITVLETPFSSFLLSDSAICSGKPFSTIFNGSTTANSGSWQIPDIALNVPINMLNGVPKLEVLPSQTKSMKGDYDVLLILSNANGCSDTGTQTIRVFSSPKADFVLPSICQNQTASIASNGSSETPIKDWIWMDAYHQNTQNGSSINITFDSAGTFLLKHIVLDANMCADTVSKNIVVKSTPKPNIVWSPFQYQDPSKHTYIFKATPSGMQDYSWTFDEAGEMNGDEVLPTFSGFKDSIQVVLKITAQNGCIADTALKFNIMGITGFYFPSAITMNNDGLNEGFGIAGPEYIKTYTLMVFNRWGEKVFETHNPYELWQPNMPVPGMYFYYCKSHDIYNRATEIKGSVMLLK